MNPFCWLSTRGGSPNHLGICNRGLALLLLLCAALTVGPAVAGDDDWGDASIHAWADDDMPTRQFSYRVMILQPTMEYLKTKGVRPVPPIRCPNVFQNYRRMVNGVCFSGDGRTLVTGTTSYGVVLWDFKTGKQRFFYHPADKPCDGHVALSADGRTLVTTGAFRGDQFEEVDFIETGTRRRRAAVHVPTRPPPGGFDAHLAGWAVSPKGTMLATCQDDFQQYIPKDRPIRLWNWATGQAVGTLPGRVAAQSMVFSADGKYLLTGGGEQEYLKIPPGAPLPQACLRTWKTSAGWVSMEVGPWRSDITLWDVAARKAKVRFPGPKGRLGTVAVSPDGRLVAVGDSERKVWVWKADTGRLWCWEAEGGVSLLAFSPDSKYLAAAAGMGVVQWDLSHPNPWTGGFRERYIGPGKALKRPSQDGYYNTCLAYAPDGKHVVVGWRTVWYDGPAGIIVFDTATGRPYEPAGHLEYERGTLRAHWRYPKGAPAPRQSAK